MLRIAIAQYAGATVLHVPPLAAGLLASTIRAAGIDAEVEIHVRRRAIEEAAAKLADARLVGISLYTWNARYALAVARRAKELRSDLVIVAGGPSVPRRDTAAFLAEHPYLDAVVIGEGELAFVDIAERVKRGEPIGGIAGVVTRAIAIARPRMTAFETIGSPYLDGTFDELRSRDEIPPIAAVVLETNRGCPFSCTFCDWGQATQSRVNELPLERIERELAWIGARDVSYLYLVDANFGIRPRDVDITRAIGRTAQGRGAPHFVFFHLTKNATQKNLRTVEILREYGVRTQVALSMQDFDADVLVAIKRDNIKPKHALALREHCHALGLSTVNELMLGLPAQTASSIRRSFVAALTPSASDTFFVYPTRVLENAEMADPAYRAQYGIVTRHVPSHPPEPSDVMHVLEREELVVASSSLSIDDWSHAFAFGHLLSAAWNQKLLQTTLHVLTFALDRDPTVFIDGLLEYEPVRAELARFTRAILDEEAALLPLAGWGDRRRDAIDAACAIVFADPDAFYAHAARIAGPIAEEAVAWDALRGSTRPRTVAFAHDWIAYEAQMAESPKPIAQPIIVGVTPSSPASVDRSAESSSVGRSLEERKHARATIAKVGVPFASFDIARARERGYVVLRGALPVDPVRAIIDRELADRGWLVDASHRLGRWDDARWHAFLATIVASSEYRTLAHHPALLAAMETVLGGSPIMTSGDVVRLVSPGATDLTTPPHQDAAYLTPTLWTAWLPIHLCPLEVGPLAILDGSHRGGLRPHATHGSDGVVGISGALDGEWHTGELAAGDAVLFSALTVHRALPNISDRVRVSITYRYEAHR